jgi:hypothetical protein
MIFQLCNGDITRKKWIEENLDVSDFTEFMSFKKYDYYLEAEAQKRMMDKTNNGKRN